MGKAARWLRSFLGAGGKKDSKRDSRATTHAEAPLPGATPKEKIRWSFRRPVVLPAAAEQLAASAAVGASRPRPAPEPETVVLFDQKKHAAADVAAATVVRLSSRSKAPPPASIILAEAAAAVRIQATFRGYLARTALCALRGIVKLQAVVRGQLVRKQAKATLRCMQALLAAQSQLRAHRMRFLQIQVPDQPPPPSRPRHHPRHRRPSYETNMRSCEENAKAVETDYSGGKGDRQRQCSPAPSSGMTTELSPTMASSWHLDASSSPQSQNVSAGADPPSYMGNTESSRAKARSQSAPRQRAMAMDAHAHAQLERQPSGRRKGAEHRSVPRGARMQRSSSQQQQQQSGSSSFFRPWSSSVKLDSSSASLRDRDRDRDSECGSTTSSVLTAATTVGYCRSLVGFEAHRSQY